MKILYSIILLAMTLTLVSAEEYATYYLRDANGNVIAEYDQDGNMKHMNIYGLDLVGRFEPEANIGLYKDGTQIGQYLSLEEALTALAADASTSDFDVNVSSTQQVELNDVSYTFHANTQTVTISGDDVVITGESVLQIAIE